MKKDIVEIDFTSQIQAAHDCDCGVCDEEECECPCHLQKAETDKAIAFSVKVVEALTAKAEDHNGDAKNSPVTFEELIEAYRKGAITHVFENQSLGEIAMARVNLLLRAKSKRFKDILGNENEKNIEKELSGLIFDCGEDSILNNSELDMFDSWTPQERDFIHAREDIEKYDLNYDFKKIDELYLDKYEQIPLELD
ncbi:hypothetical protein CL634_04525 [bacterium]|nr:hypothetical protein [bacterium]